VEWVSAFKEVSVTAATRMTATSTHRQVEVKVKVNWQALTLRDTRVYQKVPRLDLRLECIYLI
jgi:hypothetical protein